MPKDLYLILLHHRHPEPLGEGPPEGEQKWFEAHGQGVFCFTRTKISDENLKNFLIPP